MHSITNLESTKQIGKGKWRAHPSLAKDPSFQEKLYKALDSAAVSMSPLYCASEKWETFKDQACLVAKRFSRKKSFNLKSVENILQGKRRSILRTISKNPDKSHLQSPQLSVVESQLHQIQQYRIETLASRAGLRWRELNEISADYLKRTIQQSTARHLIPPLLHPVTGILSTTRTEMLQAATDYYQQLYSPDLIRQEAIDKLISSIPTNLCLSPSEQEFITGPISQEELLDTLSRCLKKSSPGLDGLLYEILSLMARHPAYQTVVIQVFNGALASGLFPSSWLQICVSLTPKKGDLADLRNYRPISLINADAKTFTRILNKRILKCSNKLINSYQTGFLRHRFIGDNGLLMKTIMDHAKTSRSHSIGLLLDQEKVYDRVHPDYLRQVLLRFGFPCNFVNSISSLFFNTSINLNINGFLSLPIRQSRGLRQSDPISPVLFNLAFEPFLRSAIQDTTLKGLALPAIPNSITCSFGDISLPSEALPSIKLLAYADDVTCLINTPEELDIILALLGTYSEASNAKVNFQKTQAMSLSGKSLVVFEVSNV